MLLRLTQLLLRSLVLLMHYLEMLRFGVPLSLLVLALFTATYVYLLFVALPNITP
jgi:hypothetical protein